MMILAGCEKTALASERPCRLTPLPVVMTSAVYVSAPFVQLADPARRISLSLTAIEKWLSVHDGLYIVICDGTNYDFYPDVRRSFPLANIECLNFRNNWERVAAQGKGFGEGEIMKYVLENSEVIRNAEWFAKCTSKLWVGNYLDCLMGFNGWFGGEKLFRRFSLTRANRIDTRFYLSGRQFYGSVLADCHQRVNDRYGYYLEHSFYDALRANGTLDIWFRKRPMVLGFSGSTDQPYARAAGASATAKAFHILRAVRFLLYRARLNGRIEAVI